MQRPGLPQRLSACLLACARLQAGPLQRSARPDGGCRGGGGARRAPQQEAQARGRAMSISFKGAGFFFRSTLSPVLALGSVVVFGLIFAACGAAQAATIHPPQGGEVRALVIGIDAYQFVPQLRGAVADARDIEQTLRSQGVRDITTLYDAAADRTTVMRTLDQLVQRSKSGDLVVLSIAGHGVQEPEHIKGSQPDGFDNVFVLAGFNPKTGAGTQQRIIGTEFNHVIKQFEAKGANVLFVADACYGGGLAREIDPRADEMSYRQAPRYALTVDNLKPISTASDAFLSDIDFERTSFLAAVDRNTKAPEVRIPGVPGFRGALSY